MAAEVLLYDEYAFDREVFDGAACAFGVFDGYHVGHRFLVDSTLSLARRSGERCVILTFDRDPDELFRPEGLRKLMTNERRIATLADSGADTVVVLPFTRSFAALDPDAFLYRTFGYYAPASLHVGADFRFGVRASGDIDTLHLWAEKSGTEIMAYRLEERDGQPVSATRIRELLAACKLREAEALLGHRYVVEGLVEPGRQQGREMGFATANLAIPANRQTLGPGVYAAYAAIGEKRCKAAVSVGASPTFGEATAVCEVHVLDFSGDLYGQALSVEFVEFLRPMQKFDHVDELIDAVMANIQWCRDNL